MSNDSKTTEAAVEAAAQALWQVQPLTRENVRAAARRALEAAGPRTITTVEEVSALPNGSQIQDADPALCEKVNGRWYITGSDYDYGDIHITLPATVLHEPEAEATR
ncbi:hypothetical protein ACFFON_15370 [Arthrobacter citreus]|uniref:hypothetical protein n=1 Tax=Arthrobacter TaxID=1663 RepID=UPI0012644CD1|nr:hypothetical protein [Arthrobacter gandavensis]